MRYFTEKYLDFFTELKQHNHKTWFDANRKLYEQEVREPFKRFIDDLISAMAHTDSGLRIEAKDAIFRINRDIRFSKDKTPYKTFNSALISRKGRKDKSYPGIYIELSPEKLGIYCGVYMADTRQIQKIRQHIAGNRVIFQEIISDPDFKAHFGAVRGEKYKRIPKGFEEVAAQQPLVRNKQWYVMASLLPSIILSDKLLETILTYSYTVEPFKNFLIEALED